MIRSKFFLFLTLLIVPVSAFAGNGNYLPEIQTLVDAVSVDNMRNDIDSLCFAGGHQSRITFTPGNYYAAEYIASRFESMPGIASVARDSFSLAVADYPYNNYPLINIRATIQGVSENPQTVIIGGHYDSCGDRQPNSSYRSNWETLKAQGADDNATGVAAVLEIARILSDPNSDFVPDHTIIFIAFGAEEGHPKQAGYGHLGSLYDAINRSRKQEPIKASLILDMIGYGSATDYTEIISDQNSLWVADILYANNDLYISGLLTNPTPVSVPYSDHESYQKYGFPSVLLMENDRPWNDDYPNYSANPYYHTTADQSGTINFNQQQKVTQLALSALVELSASGSSTAVDAFAGPVQPAAIELQVYPNPFNSAATVSFDLQNPEFVTINLFDLAGRRVAVIANNRFFNRGRHQLFWNAKNLSSGIYVLNLHSAGQTINKKLTLIR